MTTLLDDSLQFVLEVLNKVAESQGEPEQVYPFLRANLNQLDAQFLQAFPSAVSIVLENKSDDERLYIAAVIVEFGNLIQEFPLGNRLLNLEVAIQAYQDSLQVCTPSDFPVYWAMTQNNLGNAYRNRIEGERRQNLELAIQAYQDSLQVYTPSDFPVYWARTQNNLGNAYPNRIEGERRQNLELAIQAYQDSLQVYTPSDFPVDWARTQNNLGLAYTDRIEGNRLLNLELAIQAFQASLQVRTPSDFPVDWAMTQNNLGTAYANRIEGERRQNLELAIQAFQASLKVRTPSDFPVDWAMTQNNLGTAYANRIKGERRQNLELAIQAFQASLTVYTPSDFPVDWAGTLNNLGLAYTDRIEGERRQNLELAIQAFQASLMVYTPSNFPVHWAITQNNLGLAYTDRIEGERQQNVELAIQAFQASLKVRTPSDFSVDWAMTQNNLGLAYSHRIEGERRQNLERAIQRWQSALEIFKPESMPLECLKTGRNLGNLAIKEGWWDLAIEGYGAAIAAVDQSRLWATTEERRQEILNESIGVYENMLQACVASGQLDLALQTVERVRSKRLVELMASHDLYKDGNIPPQVQQFLDAIETNQKLIDQLRFDKPGTDNRELAGTRSWNRAATEAATEEIAALEAEHQRLRGELSALDAVSSGLLHISAPDLNTIQKTLLTNSDTALLSFYTTAHDTHIFIVRYNAIHLFTCKGEGFESLQRWLIDQWVNPYAYTTDNDKATWIAQMPVILQQLAQRLQLDRLIEQDYLQNVKELILIPHLLLHLIPFAALPLTPKSDKIQFLGDKFLLRYAPGCQVLQFCQQREPLQPTPHYGTAENASDNLPFAAIEGDGIATLFKIPSERRLQGRDQVTVAAYRSLLSQVQEIVSCHHAQSRLDNPLASGLILGNGSITLGQLLSPGWRFPNLGEVVLSACETGLAMPKTFADELLTLGTGFLCAGARTVLSSLWSVNDLASALLSLRYHQYRSQGKNSVTSLQLAQRDLRTMTGSDLQVWCTSQAELLDKRYRENRKQLRSLPQNSAESLRLAQENQWLETAIAHLVATKNPSGGFCQQPQPFEHPQFWAAFKCEGLG
jgi:CHAT domain-containing protein/tetratricopeptide (TPR) repeat protein